MQSVIGRQGLTIIEVIVSITILTVGALALSAAAANLTRLIGDGARYSLVATLGRTTLESLLPDACDGSATGDTVVGAFHVDWSIRPRGVVSDVVVVVSALRTKPRQDTLSTARVCIE